MVRPPDGRDRKWIGIQARCAEWRWQMWRWVECACWRKSRDQTRLWSLRIWPAPSFAGHLAVGEAKLCGPHSERPNFDSSLNRGCLPQWRPSEPGLVRYQVWAAEWNVRFQPRQTTELAQGISGSRYRDRQIYPVIRVRTILVRRKGGKWSRGGQEET